MEASLKYREVRGERVVRLVYFQSDGPCAIFPSTVSRLFFLQKMDFDLSAVQSVRTLKAICLATKSCFAISLRRCNTSCTNRCLV